MKNLGFDAQYIVYKDKLIGLPYKIYDTIPAITLSVNRYAEKASGFVIRRKRLKINATWTFDTAGNLI